MPTIEPYLYFNGNAAEVMRWYAEVLGADPPVIMTYGESPEPNTCAPGDENRVMHALLKVEGAAIMASDVPSSMPYTPFASFSIAIAYKTAAEAEVLYKQLSVGATLVQMPLQQTFWADAFAMLVDRYGVMWSISGGNKSG